MPTNDGGIGLVSMGAREYDPLIGRFISADTIVPRPGDPQSFNRYAYARNSPLSRIDPSGHGDCNVHSNSASEAWCRPAPSSIYPHLDRACNRVDGSCHVSESKKFIALYPQYNPFTDPNRIRPSYPGSDQIVTDDRAIAIDSSYACEANCLPSLLGKNEVSRYT